MLGRLGYDGAKTFGYAGMSAWEIIGGFVMVLGGAAWLIDKVLAFVGIHVGFDHVFAALAYLVVGSIALLLALLVLLAVVGFVRQFPRLSWLVAGVIAWGLILRAPSVVVPVAYMAFVMLLGFGICWLVLQRWRGPEARNAPSTVTTPEIQKLDSIIGECGCTFIERPPDVWVVPVTDCPIHATAVSS